MNGSQTITGNCTDVLRKNYSSTEQYLDFPDNSQRCQDFDAFARRRAGAGSWQMIERVAIFLINFPLTGQTHKKLNSEVPMKFLI